MGMGLLEKAKQKKQQSQQVPQNEIEPLSQPDQQPFNQPTTDVKQSAESEPENNTSQQHESEQPEQANEQQPEQPQDGEVQPEQTQEQQPEQQQEFEKPQEWEAQPEQQPEQPPEQPAEKQPEQPQEWQSQPEQTQEQQNNEQTPKQDIHNEHQDSVHLIQHNENNNEQQHQQPDSQQQESEKPEQAKQPNEQPEQPQEWQAQPEQQHQQQLIQLHQNQQNNSSKGLLQKAKTKQNTPQQQSTDKNIEIIDTQKNYGYKKQAIRQIVFDHNTSEYRYEIIEPQLNQTEQELKNELSHLFKMLADIDTFELDNQEKEKFLQETMDKIIEENNIQLTDETQQQQKHFKKTTPNTIPEKTQPKTFSELFKSKNKKQNNNESQPETKKPPLRPQSKDYIYYHIFRDFLGYGPIDILMHDDGIEDISCDGPNPPVFIHHRIYEAIETNIYYESEQQLNSFVVRLCQISGKQISIFSPIVDGKLPDGSRLQATLSRTVTKGSTFTIRKFKENPLTPIDLLKFKSLSIEMAAYFWMVIEHGASILFCGGTASGKTTALNALLLFVPPSHKIVSIEDTREVNIPHKNWIAGTTRKGFSTADEAKTGKDIDMFDLIRAALRQRPRVIIVGEVRGKEAYSLFQAMATGHTAYATVHASTIHTLIQRLENPPVSLPRALLTSLDVIVFQNAVPIGGKMVRRMTSVTEIIKLDSDTNQLIFMAPFTWVSKTDDRFENSKTSKILNKIKQQNDWSDQRMETELQNRILILNWMKNNPNVNSYKDFGKIIAQYQKFPEQLLAKIRKEMKQ
jgi:archaeal flagellar protein FlaI